MAIEELPPWQSVQPRCTVFVRCIVGSSLEVWQETQPPDFLSASSWDSPTPNVAAGFSPTWFAVAEWKAKRKDNNETPRTAMFRGEAPRVLREGDIVHTPQKVNFATPKSEKSVRPV